MVDFDNELRKKCRHCHCKLPEPTGNEREAFCARGCQTSFYRKRCRVCEEAIEQPKHGKRLICKKSKCRNAWNAGSGFGRYHENPAKTSTQSQSLPDDRWPRRSACHHRAAAQRQVKHAPSAEGAGRQRARVEARHTRLRFQLLPVGAQCFDIRLADELERQSTHDVHRMAGSNGNHLLVFLDENGLARLHPLRNRWCALYQARIRAA
jgi:hypothetical protein